MPQLVPVSSALSQLQIVRPGAKPPPDRPGRRRDSVPLDSHVFAPDAVSCTNSAPLRNAVRIRSRISTGRAPVFGR